MKKTLSIVALLAAIPVLAVAQTTPVPVTTNSAPPAVESSPQKQLPGLTDSVELKLAPQPQTKPATGATGLQFTAEGAVVQAARAGKVWQVLSPFAPAEYGDSYDNVSLDPHTRQPSGIVLFSFRFGHANRQR